MAKQKVVLKLSMEDAKKRSKAMQCATGLHGVVSATLEGDKLIVVGEGIDSVELTTLLRKKMGYVELVAVTAVEEKKEVKKEEKKEEKGEAKIVTQPMMWTYNYGQPVGAMIERPYYYVEPNNDDQSICSIM